MMKNKVLNNRLKKVDKITKQTEEDLQKDREAIMERVKAKESRVEEEFKIKKNTLKSSFNENLHKLVKNIASQREIVSASYGSLTLQNKQL